MPKLAPQDFAASTGPGSTFAFTCEMTLSPYNSIRARLPAHIAADQAFMGRLKLAIETKASDPTNPGRVTLHQPRTHTYVGGGNRSTIVEVIQAAVDAHAATLRKD